MRKIVVVVVAVLVAVAASGCEPAMTITAARESAPAIPAVSCGDNMTIIGTVTPASATSRVTLQQSSKGKWSDVVGWNYASYAYASERTVRSATVAASGNYAIPYFVDWSGSTKHLRVRSAGGTVSPSFYVKSTETPGTFCHGVG